MLRQDFDRLRRRLIRLGMPIRHVSRIVGELADHAEDIREELISSGAPPQEVEARVRERLGDFDLLAEQMDQCFVRRTFWGRHPVTTFVSLPVLSFALLLFAPIPAGRLLIFFLDLMTSFGVAVDLNIVSALCRRSFEIYRYVIAAACAGWFVCGLRRYVWSMKWSAVAAGILAALQYLIVSTIVVEPSLSAEKYLSGSFTLSIALTDPFAPDRLVRFFMPVALFFLTYAGNIRRGFFGMAGE